MVGWWWCKRIKTDWQKKVGVYYNRVFFKERRMYEVYLRVKGSVGRKGALCA